MKIELTVTADVSIDNSLYPDITPERILEAVVVRDSDLVDGFEITTDIDSLDNTKNFFLTSAKIAKKRLIKDKCYFLVHRKFSDTWHIGYADDSDSGMISIAPTNIPQTYESKKAAMKGMRNIVIGFHEHKSFDEVYEIDKFFDKAEAIAFAKHILKIKKKYQNENNPG